MDNCWEGVPEWVGAGAMDRNGRWYWYASTPLCSYELGEWMGGGRQAAAPDGWPGLAAPRKWSQSLLRRWADDGRGEGYDEK
jgi:hypothetical protein